MCRGVELDALAKLQKSEQPAIVEQALANKVSKTGKLFHAGNTFTSLRTA